MKGNVIIGKELQWEKIKVGQAFYFYGCEGIAVKVDKVQAVLIDATGFMDIDDTLDKCGTLLTVFSSPVSILRRRFTYYTLPKSLAECLEVEL